MILQGHCSNSHDRLVVKGCISLLWHTREVHESYFSFDTHSFSRFRVIHLSATFDLLVYMPCGYVHMYWSVKPCRHDYAISVHIERGYACGFCHRIGPKGLS